MSAITEIKADISHIGYTKVADGSNIEKYKSYYIIQGVKNTKFAVIYDGRVK